MSRLVDKIFERLTMNLENSNFELTEKRVRLQFDIEIIQNYHINTHRLFYLPKRKEVIGT